MSHANARLTPRGRLILVERITAGWPVSRAARAAALLPDGPALIVAPAGSGKTTTLVARLGCCWRGEWRPSASVS